LFRRFLPGVEKSRAAIKPGIYAGIIAAPENPPDYINTLKKTRS
jgi:hypothetical protein